MTTCRICGHRKLTAAFDLGHHPLADRFLLPVEAARPTTFYPLRGSMCDACRYVGLDHVVPAADRYQSGAYSYTAGNSSVSRAHFRELARGLAPTLGEYDLVVDIGGNDGTFLTELEGRCMLWNVEPSSIAELSESLGIPTDRRLWGDDVADDIVARGGASLIVTTNTLNHASDPLAFVRAVARALRPGGRFVFEVPSWTELLARGAWDTIYLEHVSYFGTYSLMTLLGLAGLCITSVEAIDYMGGSLRVATTLGKGHAVGDRVAQEAGRGAVDAAAAQQLGADAYAFRGRLRGRLRQLAQDGAKVVAVGAAAKGNTLLNYCQVDRSLVDCVVDSSPHKIGKYTPGSLLPIVGEAAFPRDATHALILPWNIAEHLTKRVREIGPPGIEVIVPEMAARSGTLAP